jgi:hypothetical protein
MRALPGDARLDVVNAPGPVHVVLDIEPTDGTISGQVAVGSDHAAGFHGWLELIDRIERAIDQTRPKAAIQIEQPLGERR